MSTHPAQAIGVVNPPHARGGDPDRSRAKSAIESKGTKKPTKPEKNAKVGIRSGVSVNLSGTSIKTRAGRADKKTVTNPRVQIDESLIERLLRSGPACLKDLSALAEEFCCLGEEDDNERAFVIETATLCLRQACAESEPGVTD